MVMSETRLEGQTNVKHAAEEMIAKAKLNPGPDQIPIGAEVLYSRIQFLNLSQKVSS
ncbi:hypothetical protein DSO57_1019192 [Entomophthora muscae]|uniref:Uncharacterized protein n=1 Tax=Entomophthora muscae TaxID=34485 RepID=A0ACC2SHD5_9FUNG|nr:hypothetical protein DSO57_1019192 [Entomophthora muscae]